MCKYAAYIIDTLNHYNTISELLKPDERIHTLLEKHKAELAQHGQMTIDFKA
jgi:hypothetical protein